MSEEPKPNAATWFIAEQVKAKRAAYRDAVGKLAWALTYEDGAWLSLNVMERVGESEASEAVTYWGHTCREREVAARAVQLAEQELREAVAALARSVGASGA